MTDLSVLLLGLGLGLRHATDVDHVVVVSALVQREPGAWSAARVAALWGAGHTVTFLVVGLLIVIWGIRLPAAFDRGVELMVAVMLVSLGLWHLVRSSRSEAFYPSSLVGATTRSMILGLFHGLAGSAGVALLAVTTVRSADLAVLYLGLVALGTVIGMVAFTLVLSRPIAWTMRRPGLLKQSVTVATGLLSVGLGLLILVPAIFGRSST